MLDGLRCPSRRVDDVREIDERRDVVRAQLDRLPDRLRRLVEPPLGEQRVREIAPGVRVLGVGCGCLLELAQGVVASQLDARLAGEAEEIGILRARLQERDRKLPAALEVAVREQRLRLLVRRSRRLRHYCASATLQYLPL